MSAKFYTLLTDIGAAKLANATALGVPLNITQMAVGDGGGSLPSPGAQQTTLVAEKRRAPLNMLYIDPQNSSQIIAEQVIPETEGGWWIREVGLLDETGALIAVGNCPESYKPQLAEGSGRTQTVRMVLITSSTDNITLKIDPSVVLATRKYVDDEVLELKLYVDELRGDHLAAADPHPQYLKITDLDDFIPVGIPLPWPQATPPDGWLKCNGAAFDKTNYPKLAVAYPSGSLPDLRGEFLRGWDDGRGIDINRRILSAQSHAMQRMTGSANAVHAQTVGATFDGDGVLGMTKVNAAIPPSSGGGNYGGFSMMFDNNISGINTASENRPRNVAFNYIVRAA
ncbi:phage tail protein [Serratia symbiotica]|uniref:phage tail protein n=1 Tax=Serratia symbiotica TaxID=138074 RepID=UPI0013259651|nr:phage tail protein [Serratia symbiotica]QTP13802.1 phage tail protein [Serratia symbiotica]QTP14951.1 phage tail protein [Serratia symbiotica]